MSEIDLNVLDVALAAATGVTDIEIVGCSDVGLSGVTLAQLASDLTVMAIPAPITHLRTLGYAVVGKGAATYQRVGAYQSGDLITVGPAYWRVVDEVVDGYMFGAAADGVTSDRAALQTALTVLLARGGGTLNVPAGAWTLLAGDAPLDPGAGNIRIIGQAGARLSYHEGTTAAKNYAFSNTTNTAKGDLTIVGLTISGTLATRAIRAGNPLWLDYYRDVVIERCVFESIAGEAMDFHYLRSFRCRGNLFRDIAADAVRCRDTADQIVTDNIILRNGDDAIALHTDSTTLSTWPGQARQIVVAQNHITNGGSIKVLGARTVIISKNTVRFGNVQTIHLGYALDYVEGDNPVFSWIVTDNLSEDLMQTTTGGVSVAPDSHILLRMPNARGGAVTNGATPLRYDAVGGAIIRTWDWSLANGYADIDPLPPGQGIVVSGNICRRTAKSGAAFSTLGHGTRLFQGVSSDPVLSDTLLRPAFGMRLSSPHVVNCTISGNVIEHVRYGISAVAATSSLDFRNVRVVGNTFFDCLNYGVQIASSNFRCDWLIEGNTIDCDPYRVNANSTLAGAYAADGTPRGVDMGNVIGATIRNNTFANCCKPIANNSALNVIEDNTAVLGQPAALGFNVANKGIGNVPSGHGWKYQIVDADPTSASYGLTQHIPQATGGGQPASGWYPRGWVVRNTAPTLDGASLTALGWMRLTTGSGHVAGTDWAVLRASHVSPSV